MNSIENPTGGEREKRCAYVYPEGHEKQGQQCRGMAGRSGYCGGHRKHAQPDAPVDALVDAPADAHGEASGGVSGIAGTASASLAASAAAWLDSPATQEALRARWNKILRNGADADAIRLWKELNDARPEAVEVEIPRTLVEIQAMSDDELRAALLQLEAAGY